MFALAGGSTPKGLYQKLATSPYIEQIDWARVQIFFGDGALCTGHR